MAQYIYKYVIVGGGLAGASAVEGIRQRDPDGTILLIGAEKDLPYNRPPLSKTLWTGKKKVEDIFVHDSHFYAGHKADLRLGMLVTKLLPDPHRLVDRRGNTYQYEKLLLATGGTPRQLDITGGKRKDIIYYRTLADFIAAHGRAVAGSTALVIGGGFIGSEIAASLAANGVQVTMLFSGPYIASHVFPESLGRALQETYRARGVLVLSDDMPVGIRRRNGTLITRTRAGHSVESDQVIAGIGITPNIDLAQSAGLTVANGIVVDDRLRTSHPDIFAAGDNAFFPESVLGPTRVEHWDNALEQGRHAGRTMAGDDAPFTHIPYFFSDLFDFGYEAVGQVSSHLPTFADWQEENKTGVVYYLHDNRVRGVMLCNVWNKIDAARELIRTQQPMDEQSLRGAIK